MNGQLLKLKNARAHKGEGSSVQNLTCLFFLFLKEDLIFLAELFKCSLSKLKNFIFFLGAVSYPFVTLKFPEKT